MKIILNLNMRGVDDRGDYPIKKISVKELGELRNIFIRSLDRNQFFDDVMNDLGYDSNVTSITAFN